MKTRKEGRSKKKEKRAEKEMKEDEKGENQWRKYIRKRNEYNA